MNYVQKAIDICGSQSELARRCGVRQQNVWKWRNRPASIPAERAIAIELATGGAVTAEDLRPDIPWHVIRGVEKRGALDAGKAGDEAAKCGE